MTFTDHFDPNLHWVVAYFIVCVIIDLEIVVVVVVVFIYQNSFVQKDLYLYMVELQEAEKPIFAIIDTL